MGYEEMAFYYDQLMKNAPYDQWIDFTLKILKAYQKPVRVIADLGCGTGEITTRLATKDYSLIGVDQSSTMLAVADQKAQTKKVDVKWVKQDLRTLQGLQNVDVAISYCDVMNYITTEEELKQTFKNIYNLLSPSGLFIFDVHSLKYTDYLLKKQTFAHVEADLSYIWFCIPGSKSGEMFHELTFFQLDKDGNYRRFDELHHQRAFTERTYHNLLLDAGFKKVNQYSDFTISKKSSDENSERIFFVAAKDRDW